MKRILIAAVAFAALPAAALANDARPQPSFNDNVPAQYQAPVNAPSGRAEFPRPSFVDYSELTGGAETTSGIAADAVQPARSATAALPQPSFNG